ncbi:MAG: hypothetical protein L6290_06155 [Thermodesulfovibrionales bacterium]|nr:hypothetical protein [Thermodesulfovibrionales bacterium]
MRYHIGMGWQYNRIWLMEKNTIHIVPRYIIYSFFILGLISAIAFRTIIVIQRVEPGWIRPVWYTGTIGYFFFFLYRYLITLKRKKAIEEFQLIEKLKVNACLTEKDREVVLYLLSSVKYSLEDINYAIIFLLSVLAIAADLLLSLL